MNKKSFWTKQQSFSETNNNVGNLRSYRAYLYISFFKDLILFGSLKSSGPRPKKLTTKLVA